MGKKKPQAHELSLQDAMDEASKIAEALPAWMDAVDPNRGKPDVSDPIVFNRPVHDEIAQGWFDDGLAAAVEKLEPLVEKWQNTNEPESHDGYNAGYNDGVRHVGYVLEAALAELKGDRHD